MLSPPRLWHTLLFIFQHFGILLYLHLHLYRRWHLHHHQQQQQHQKKHKSPTRWRSCSHHHHARFSLLYCLLHHRCLFVFNILCRVPFCCWLLLIRRRGLCALLLIHFQASFCGLLVHNFFRLRSNINLFICGIMIVTVLVSGPIRSGIRCYWRSKSRCNYRHVLWK